MINRANFQNWTYEHFLAYIFLCLAEADNDLDQEELVEIKRLIVRVTGGDEEEYHKIIHDALKVVSSHDEQERRELFLVLKESFLMNEEQKEKLIEGMEDIIIADLNIEPKELDLYRFIKGEIGKSA